MIECDAAPGRDISGHRVSARIERTSVSIAFEGEVAAC